VAVFRAGKGPSRRQSTRRGIQDDPQEESIDATSVYARSAEFQNKETERDSVSLLAALVKISLVRKSRSRRPQLQTMPNSMSISQSAEVVHDSAATKREEQATLT
jgi:hypothetical protein